MLPIKQGANDSLRVSLTKSSLASGFIEEYNRNNQPGVGVIASLDFLGLGPNTGETIKG